MRLDVLESAARAGVPRGGLSRDNLLTAMRQAQVAYLRATLGHDDSGLDPAIAESLRRHAAYLDLLAEQVGDDQATDAWHVIGTIYEWLSRMTPTPVSHAAAPSLTRGAVGDLIRSSLAYSSGLHEASSALAADRALSSFVRLEVSDTVVQTAGLTILRLLARRFVEAIGGVAAYGAAVQTAIEADAGGDRDWPTLGILGRIAEAAACQASAMLSGSDDLFAEAANRFADAEAVARTSADDVAALTSRLSRAAAGMTARSTYRVLRAAGIPGGVVGLFASERPELWSVQASAIERGLLDPDRAFVLSLPTGSGKTFLAQLRVLATLDRYPESWVAYVAPSRALVREAYADLAAALRPHNIRVQKLVASAEASVLLEEDEVPAISGNRTCAVLTPERLDLYLRTSPNLAARCRLVVVDEAHHIGDPHRGARLEALIGLLLTRWPEARPVLLSAFMSNADELAKWLGNDAGAFHSTERPTRQLRGVLLRHAERRLSDIWIHGTGANRRVATEQQPGWRQWHRNRRGFDVGALISTSDSPPTATPTDIRAYALPSITHGTRWTEIRPPARPGAPPRIDRNAGTGISDIAIDVGVELAAHPGLVLMFFPTIDWAQSATRAIARRLPLREDLAVVAAAVAEVLGTDHPLVEALQHGCAYHHSQMPDDVIRIIEAVARGQLDVLCATSGLQAGVNFPASIVVAIGDPTKPVGASPTPRDFANMAGRAGRPRYDSEGLALILPSSITYGEPLPRIRRYLAPGEEDTTVVSALGASLEQLAAMDAGLALGDLPEAVQQVLLMLWATDIREADDVARFLENTLGGRPLASQVGAQLSNSVAAAAARRGATFSAFAKTALPYSACDPLVASVPRLVAHFDDDDWRSSPARQAVTVTGLLLGVPYFDSVAMRRLGVAYSPDAVASMVAGWLRGRSYDELGAILGFGPGRPARAVRAVNELTGYIAWGAGSLLSLVTPDSDMAAMQPLLPYLIRFGVDTSVAAYLRLLGVSDRLGAIDIARQYPPGADVNFAAVDAWTRSQAGRQAIGEHYADNAVRRATTERDLGLETGPARALPLFFSARGDLPDWLTSGTFVRLHRDDGGWLARDLVSQSNWPLDTSPADGVAVVTGVEGQRMRAVLFVPTEDQALPRLGVA